MTFQNSFSSMDDFRAVVSVLLCSPSNIKARGIFVIFVAVRKMLIDNEPSWLFDCNRLSTLKQRPRLQIDWRQQKGALFILIYFSKGGGGVLIQV